MRVFVAVDLPEELQPKITDIQSKFSDFKFKFVKPDIMHITMKFLGEVPEEMLEKISKALDSVSSETFETTVRGVGVFPKPRFAKVIWLGCEGDFEQLHSSIEESLSSFEFVKDLHPFSAHATLARVKYLPKKKKEDFMQLLDELKDIDVGKMQVRSIRLKKSTLTPEGPVYETLHEVMLG